jgi:hypothetical protein
MFIRLGKGKAINLSHITSIDFSHDADDNISAVLKYRCSTSAVGFVTEKIDGEPAGILSEAFPEERDPNAPLTLTETDSGELQERPMDPKDRELERAFQPEFARTKSWFYYVQKLVTFDDPPIEERRFFVAFVNAKGSCSMRTFDADTGQFVAKTYRGGNYQQQFAAIIRRNATELSVSPQPNLERDCKERLPDPTLASLKKQAGI